MKREGLLSQLIDITPALRTGAAVFPGDAPYRVTQTFAIGPGCPVNVTEVSMSTHCGAHADAPSHYAADAKSIEAVALEDYIGPARLIDARGAGARVDRVVDLVGEGAGRDALDGHHRPRRDTLAGDHRERCVL